MNFILQRKKPIIILSVLLILVISLFPIRNWYFNTTLKKVQQKLETQYQLKLSIGKSSFSGIHKLSIQEVLVSSTNTDSLIYLDSVHVQVKIWDLFKRDIHLKRIYLQKLSLTFSQSDIELLMRSKTADTAKHEISSTMDYTLLLNRVANKFFTSIPNEITIDSLELSYKGNNGQYNLMCPSLILKQKHFSGNFFLFNDQNAQTEYSFSGHIVPSENSIETEFRRNFTNNKIPPFKDPILGLGLQVDTVQLGFSMNSPYKGIINFSGQFKTSGLTLNHEKLAPEPISVSKASINFNTRVTKNTFEIDSSSVITINEVSFSPYFRFQNEPYQKVSFKIIEKEYEVDQIIQSFPKGLFENTRGIIAKGAINYDLSFSINLENPDSIVLLSVLKNKNLQIESFGSVNLAMIKDTFTYEVYDHEQKKRSLFVGPGNPNFVPLADISDYLKYAVITSEDGGFYYHKGFDQESIKKSISDNLKKGRFARGGSTITMQLVKNVYLSKSKTLSRKLEELLIVWMIENLNLVTKDRMFEVYLNIIEWGPGVYGIKEASEFYFHKKPSKLTLAESIYLASVVPSPRNFKYTFTKEGQLRDYYGEYYRFLSETMLSRNSISVEDTIGLKPNIKLTGDAKDLLRKTDTIISDTLLFDNNLLLELEY